MAITPGNNATFLGTTSTPSWSHIVAAGSNQKLIVCLDIGTATDVVTGITYNGVAMQRITQSSSTGRSQYAYELSAPAIGSNTIAVSLTGSQTVNGISLDYEGVLQAPLASFGTGSDPSASSIDALIVPTKVRSFAVGFFKSYSSSVLTAGSGATQRVSGTDATARIYDSNTTIPVENYTMTVNSGTNTRWRYIAFPLPPSTLPVKSLMGIGT